MRFKEISLIMILALILVVFSITAFSELIENPKAGTIEAQLVPYLEAENVDSEAYGHVIINYVKGKDRFEIQVNVSKLLPGTEYEVLINWRDEPGYLMILGTFLTDEFGNGHLHVRETRVIKKFNLINIRFPDVGGSRKLTSWEGDGGSLQQYPSER